MTDESPKKRGGQPGNHNAFKHGFYSKGFLAEENRTLNHELLGKMEDEIALMRALILRTVRSLKTDSQISFRDYLRALRTVTFAVTCIQAIYRTQKYVNDDGTTALYKALESIKDIPFEED